MPCGVLICDFWCCLSFYSQFECPCVCLPLLTRVPFLKCHCSQGRAGVSPLAFFCTLPSFSVHKATKKKNLFPSLWVFAVDLSFASFRTTSLMLLPPSISTITSHPTPHPQEGKLKSKVKRGPGYQDAWLPSAATWLLSAGVPWESRWHDHIG